MRWRAVLQALGRGPAPERPAQGDRRPFLGGAVVNRQRDRRRCRSEEAEYRPRREHCDPTGAQGIDQRPSLDRAEAGAIGSPSVSRLLARVSRRAR